MTRNINIITPTPVITPYPRHCECKNHYLHNMYKGGAIYIMSSPNKTTLYTGVTSNLPGRVYEHKSKKYPASFTARYNCTVIVYYKYFDSIAEAIAEEKRLKGGSRAQKDHLIHEFNPQWEDLYQQVLNFI